MSQNYNPSTFSHTTIPSLSEETHVGESGLETDRHDEAPPSFFPFRTLHIFLVELPEGVIAPELGKDVEEVDENLIVHPARSQVRSDPKVMEKDVRGEFELDWWYSGDEFLIRLEEYNKSL